MSLKRSVSEALARRVANAKARRVCGTRVADPLTSAALAEHSQTPGRPSTALYIRIRGSALWEIAPLE